MGSIALVDWGPVLSVSGSILFREIYTIVDLASFSAMQRYACYSIGRRLYQLDFSKLHDLRNMPSQNSLTVASNKL